MPLDIPTILQRKARLPLKRSRVKASKLTPNQIAKQRMQAQRQFPGIRELGDSPQVSALFQFKHLTGHSQVSREAKNSADYEKLFSETLHSVLKSPVHNPDGLILELQDKSKFTYQKFKDARSLVDQYQIKLESFAQTEVELGIRGAKLLEQRIKPSSRRFYSKRASRKQKATIYIKRLQELFDKVHNQIIKSAKATGLDQGISQDWQSKLDDSAEASLRLRAKIQDTKADKVASIIVLPSVFKEDSNNVETDMNRMIDKEMFSAAFKILMKLPNKLIDILYENCVRIFFGRNMPEADLRDKEVDHTYGKNLTKKIRDYIMKKIPGVHIDSRSNKMAYGAYANIKSKRAWLSERVWKIKPLDQRIKTLGYTLRHEIGHIVDGFMKLFPKFKEEKGDLFSSSSGFQTAYKQDFEKLTDDEKRDHSYYIHLNCKTKVHTVRGLKESFADLFASFVGGGQKLSLVEKFPNTHQWIKDNVMPHVT